MTGVGAPGMADGAREAVTALVDLGIGRHVAEIVTVTVGSVLCPEHVVTVIKAIKGE